MSSATAQGDPFAVTDDKALLTRPRQPSRVEPASSTGARDGDMLLATVFVIAVFLSSTLLFLVQPLVARLLLPLAGGSAALWNTAMVFFQVTLLLGYGFAHTSIRRVGSRRHPILQGIVLLVPLAVLPLAVPNGWSLPNDVAPALWVLGILALMVGLPFFALATTSPTLQVWFSSTNHSRAADPYFLYAAGNIGSVLALIGYPLIFEPLFSLKTQTRIWAVGYALFIVACFAAGYLTRRHHAVRPASTATAETEAEASAALSVARRARWLLWGFIPSALMLGVTLHITTDLASFPLLWIVPLLLYLVTFIIAFGGDSLTRVNRTSKFVWLTAVPLGLSFFLQQYIGVYILLFHLVWFFAGALLCHSRLAADRPPASQLTEFYLILSFGGALGGIFASLLAPMLFTAVIEYPIAIALVLMVAVQPQRRIASTSAARVVAGLLLLLLGVAVLAPTQIALIGLAAAILLLVSHGPKAAMIVMIGLLAAGPSTFRSGNEVLQDRSFFGVYTVVDEDGVRTLVSGTTSHGTQLLDQETARATTYYFAGGPAGQVFEAVQPRNVGVIGLGAGTLAQYGRSGDTYTFWEIDQLVVDIASDPNLFTYLSQAQADVEIIVDDGRHGIAAVDGGFDVIVLDAFGSDAIPVHLLTTEAMQLYLSKLAPDGTLLVHISNRHFGLRPIVASAAEAAGAQAFGQLYVPDAEERAIGATGSEWVAVAPAGTTPAWLDDGRFEPLDGSGTRWTDDYSNVLGIMKFD